MTQEPGKEARTAVSPDPFIYPLLEQPEGWSWVPSLSGWEGCVGAGPARPHSLQTAKPQSLTWPGASVHPSCSAPQRGAGKPTAFLGRKLFPLNCLQTCSGLEGSVCLGPAVECLIDTTSCPFKQRWWSRLGALCRLQNWLECNNPVVFSLYLSS